MEMTKEFALGSLKFKVSRLAQLTFQAGSGFVRRALLCIARCGEESITSTPQIPTAVPSCGNPKCPQTSPDVPWGNTLTPDSEPLI